MALFGYDGIFGGLRSSLTVRFNWSIGLPVVPLIDNDILLWPATTGGLIRIFCLSLLVGGA